MAQELTVREKQELQLKEHATGLIVTLSNADTAREFERGLTIAKIVNESLPLVEMMRVTSSKEVARTIDVALTKLVASVNVGNNISDYQIKEIVEDLIDKYQHETIEDFILVFKKARLGEFGTIYNLHSAVIFEWMEKYLDQKYSVRDAIREKERNEEKKVPLNNDWLSLWKESIEETDREGGVKTQSQNLTILSNLRAMTDKEISEEGQERPKYKPHQNGLTEDDVIMQTNIRRAASNKYKNEQSFTGFKNYLVGKWSVFAKSQEDAEEIVLKANG